MHSRITAGTTHTLTLPSRTSDSRSISSRSNDRQRGLPQPPHSCSIISRSPIPLMPSLIPSSCFSCQTQSRHTSRPPSLIPCTRTTSYRMLMHHTPGGKGTREWGTGDFDPSLLPLACFQVQARKVTILLDDRRKLRTQWQSKSRTEVTVVVPVQWDGTIGNGMPALDLMSVSSHLPCLSHDISRTAEERKGRIEQERTRRGSGQARTGSLWWQESGSRFQWTSDCRENGNNGRVFASFSHYDATILNE